MKHKLIKKGNPPELRFTKYGPYAAIVAIIVVSYFVLFHTGIGSINSVQAQVNPGRIGEAVVDTVTEAAAEKEAELSEAFGELGSTDATPEEVADEEFGENIPVDMPSEDLEAMAELYTGEGSAYYTSREGLGGKTITQLTPAELHFHILELTEIGGSLDMAKLAMPIMTRFQTMVSPPQDIGDDMPWLSGERRYSPFDVVGTGGGGPPPRGTGPIPAFPNPEGTNRGPVGLELTAADIARGLKLVGVMGETGGYFAILNVQGQEQIVRVGDEIGPYMEKSYNVTEITLDAVKIANVGDSGDTGLITFVEREVAGITEFSISG